MIRKLLLAAIALVLVVVGVSYYAFKNGSSNASLAGKGVVRFQVEAGSGASEIAQELKEEGLVTNPFFFRIQCKLMGAQDSMKAGIYELTAGSSNKAIIEKFVRGEVANYVFTIPEGYTIRQIAAKLEKEKLGSAEKFCALAKDYAPYEYMETDDPNVIFKAEGFVFPSTYFLGVGMSEEAILEFCVDEFDKQYSQEMREATRKTGRRIRDIVTMASLVEKEAVHEEEQPVIAGVFYKRLEIGMLIQSDTTVQYILPEHREEVLISDTKIESPYNTYLNLGLPPGPIASPGLSALKASIEPKATEYLYFVAQKDGHHCFTTNYAEHLKAIERIDEG